MKTSIFSFACTFALCTVAQSALVVEAEVGGIVNNTTATAQAIGAASFTTPVPPTVFNPPGWATATVSGTGGGTDVDFYSFTTTGGGSIFDIDSPTAFDTIVSVFNSAGTLIAYVDDNAGDVGSSSGLDSLIGVLTLAPGSYYAAVSQFSNFPSARFSGSDFTLTRPGGGFGGIGKIGATPGLSSFPVSGPDGTGVYTLHISLEAAGVPEPSSLFVWSLLAMVAAGGIKLRK